MRGRLLDAVADNVALGSRGVDSLILSMSSIAHLLKN